MSAFHRLCRFIDRDLSKTGYIRSGGWSLSIAMLILSMPLLAFTSPYRGAAAWAVAAAVSLCLIWLGFVAWRGVRIMRATSRKSDRRYDREGKFLLAPEYHGSDSATGAARRKRRGKR